MTELKVRVAGALKGARAGTIGRTTGPSWLTAATVLSAPQNLVGAVVGYRQVRLDWSPVAGATSYAVFEEASGWTTPVTTVTEPTRTSGQLGITTPVYTYRVAARAADGTQSELSAPATVDISENETTPIGDITPPTVPVITSVVPDATYPESALVVSWTASTDAVGVAGYQLRRGDQTIAANWTSGRVFADYFLNSGVAQSYTVRAYDAAGNYSAWSPAVVGTTSQTPPTGGGGGSALTFATDSQIASLSTTSPAALRAKGIADAVRSGSFVAASNATHDWHNVDARLGAIALTTALWWRRTGDNSYLQPCINYILGGPKMPPSLAGRALDPMRQAGGVLGAAKILIDAGVWNNSWTLPNHGGITWTQFIHGGYSGIGGDQPLQTRILDTTNGRWAAIRTIPASNRSTVDDSASNWGGTAHFSQLMAAIIEGDAAGVEHARKRMKKFLGDQTTGLPDFKATGSYQYSWNNVPGRAAVSGSNQNLASGVGYYDPANPGLDGVIINDADRGSTDYNASQPFYGMGASGRTYSLENTDYRWAVAAVFANNGEPIRTWGEHGDAFDRMNRRLHRVRPGDSQSLFDYTEAASSVYGGGRFIAAQLSRADYGQGSASPTATGTGGLSRAMPYGDWLAPADGSSTWGR